ncbi:MAG: hypothetical protein MMC23_003456 [Stictis urceolatum]|nr:hypothetical protein [Stictis urceolata]
MVPPRKVLVAKDERGIDAQRKIDVTSLLHQARIPLKKSASGSGVACTHYREAFDGSLHPIPKDASHPRSGLGAGTAGQFAGQGPSYRSRRYLTARKGLFRDQTVIRFASDEARSQVQGTSQRKLRTHSQDESNTPKRDIVESMEIAIRSIDKIMPLRESRVSIQNSTRPWLSIGPTRPMPPSIRIGTTGDAYLDRRYHCRNSFSTNARSLQRETTNVLSTGSYHSPQSAPAKHLPVRERLRLWEIDRQAEETRAQEQTVTALADHASMTNTGRILKVESRTVSDGFSDEIHHAVSEQEPISISQEPDDFSLYSHSPSHFREGDVVEYLHNGHCQLAVFTKRFEKQCQLYSMNGEWLHRRAEDTLFALPGLFDATDVESISKYLPQADISDDLVDQLQPYASEVPREVSAPLINKMQAFVREARNTYRTHSREIDHVYKALAHDQKIIFMTLRNITCKILAFAPEFDVPKSTLWAVHQHLRLNELGFLPSTKRHWDEGEWEIIPQSEMSRLDKVRTWVREHQEKAIARVRSAPYRALYENALTESDGQSKTEIAGFARRSRETIAESRKHRRLANHGAIGPCLTQAGPLSSSSPDDGSLTPIRDIVVGKRTSSDTTILRFMSFWATKRRVSSQVSVLCSMILRATRMYEQQELNRNIVVTFLQELGVVYPWENLDVYNSRLSLPDATSASNTTRLLGLALESGQHFDGKDSMSDLRKDWGDMEVFCVDESSAAEIDDGFSLEIIPGDPCHHWVHVHVANPTAFLTPSHPVSQYARELTESLYLPEHIYSMIPAGLSSQHFSLDSDRPVLTFSAKLSDDGEIVDHDITPGIIRNVTFMEPGTVGRALGSEMPEKRTDFTYTVGEPWAHKTDNRNKLTTEPSLDQKRILAKIADLAGARARKFSSSRAALAFLEAPRLSVSGQQRSHAWLNTTRRVEGDPTITVRSRFEDFDMQLQTANSPPNLVSSLMILAGQVAGAWCSERGIPAVYRGTMAAPGLAKAADDFQRSVVDVVKDEQGKIPYIVGRRLTNLWPQASARAVPHRHEMLNADSYIKATSPLRRYGDMLAHWQIEATLRREAMLGRSLAGEREAVADCLPLSRAEVEGLVPKLSRRELLLRLTMIRSQAHWYHQLLFRAHHFEEDPSLPKLFTMHVTNASSTRSVDAFGGMVRELNYPALLVKNDMSRKLGGVQIGDRWEVKIQQIDAISLQILMEPVVLLGRSDLGVYS